MKNTYVLALLAFIFWGCGLNNNKVVNATNPAIKKGILELHPRNDMQFIIAAEKKTHQLILENRHTPYSELQKQKEDRMEKNSEVLISTSKPEKMNGNQMYFYLKERTMLVAMAYKCTKCPNTHLVPASGYIISEDGVVVTNWHLFEPMEGMKMEGVFAVNSEGKVYPVTKVLSASKTNDIAILQLDTNGEKLKSLPFAEDELVGQDIYMMGHPAERTYTMTKGIITRKYIDEFDKEPRIGVTADFAQGASGGPIVNDNGQLAGMVRATFSLYTGDGTKENGEIQMVVKQVIPVSVIHKYVKQK
jgi:S1-C subfamily serine protease